MPGGLAGSVLKPGMHLVQVSCFFSPTVYSSSPQAMALTPEEVLK
jgi:hypothetical protein